MVEYTGGSTGASLALVCALTGHPLHIVTSDAFSADKLTQMAAFGADLTVIPSANGLITKALITQMIETAESISRRTGAYLTNQLSNADSIEGYFPMGEEPGPHRIEGIGVGYTPPLWDSRLVDEIVPVPTADAEAMARRRPVRRGSLPGPPRERT